MPINNVIRSTLTASLLTLVIAFLPGASSSLAEGGPAKDTPVCPSTVDVPYPEFPEAEKKPHSMVWNNLPAIPSTCHITVQTPIAMTVAIAARFKHTGTLEDIASRLGAISMMQNLTYWSVTDNGWRQLVSDAVALGANNNKSTRSDFTGAEVLSGETLYFAQNDTRSWGLNIYSLKTISASPDQLVFSSENISPVKLGPITLFAPHTAQTVVFVTRADDMTWSYYSLAVLKDISLGANDKSLINRQAALYRFLAKLPSDLEPPLAR